MDNAFMPWKTLGQMTDDELEAVFAHLAESALTHGCAAAAFG